VASSRPAAQAGEQWRRRQSAESARLSVAVLAGL
jgi:hypothetical protein